MTSTTPATTPAYRPLGRLSDEQREKVIRGALQQLAEEKTLVDVAKHFKISKATLLLALNTYAEDDWKQLQIARAQIAVQRSHEKRAQIAGQLEGFAEQEKDQEKTTETHMTYPRIREQLRIAEHDEKSAQWHLERLHKRLYGNSVAMTVESKSYEPDEELLQIMSDLLKSPPKEITMPNEQEAAEIIRQANAPGIDVWEKRVDWYGEQPSLMLLLTRIDAQFVNGKWWRRAKPVDAEVLSETSAPRNSPAARAE